MLLPAISPFFNPFKASVLGFYVNIDLMINISIKGIKKYILSNQQIRERVKGYKEKKFKK